MIGPWSTLNEILARTVELRRLQQEIRGEETDAVTEDVPEVHRSYRYGIRRCNPGQSNRR